MRAWERALRRADVPLAYSHGFNPRPKLTFASPLPVGFTGRAEMVDILLQRRMELGQFASRLKRELPTGVQLVSVTEVSSTQPPLPGQVSAAEYEVLVESQESPGQVQVRLSYLLAAESVPRRRDRPGRVRVYDLRPLIKELWLIGHRENMYVIGMRLQGDQHGTGRPDEVMEVLGLAEAVRGIERVRLLFAAAE